MKLQSTALLVAFCTMTLHFSSFPARANGFRLPNKDAFAGGRGGAFVATADNPSAIYYNPAGITQLTGHNLRGGLYGIDFRTRFDSPLGGGFDNQRDGHLLPNLYYTFTPERLPLSFGVGTFMPFGLSTRWPDDTGFRTLATQASLKYYTINPVVAWKPSPDFAIGAGITFNYADLDLQRGLFWPAQPFDNFKFDGDGWDLGYNLGILWKPHKKVSLGVSYRSDTTVDLDGHTQYQNAIAVPPSPPSFPGIPPFPQQKVSARTQFPFPSILILGISFRPTPDWNLEFNADYADWSRLQTIKLKQATGFYELLPQEIPLTLDWDASWYYEFGATRNIASGWSISAGYIYNENSIPDQNYTPAVGDLNRHFFTIGAGYKGRQLHFDIAYEYGYGPSRTVSGSASSPIGQTADGDYEFESHALAASVGWHF